MRYFIFILFLYCPFFGALNASESKSEDRFLYAQDQKPNGDSILISSFGETSYSENFGLKNGNYRYPNRHQIFTGFYYGFLLCIVICNFFFYLKFSEKVYFYYLVFLCTYAVAILCRDGSMNLILPNRFLIDLEGVSRLLTQITMFLFAFVFLDFRTYVPQFKRYAIILVISMTLMEMGYFITGNLLFYTIADSIAMFSFLITWLVCFLFMRKIIFTRFYIPGYAILIVFGIHFLFSYNFGLIPNNGQTLFLKIASITDMLIFTYAISYRMDVLNKEYRKSIKELRMMLIDLQKRLGNSSFYVLLEKNTITNKVLTVQELKVLKCIHQGMVNREIAEQLFVSTNTIKFHVRNIYKKLNVKNRNEVNRKLEKLSLEKISKNQI